MSSSRADDRNDGVEQVALDELLARTDIVTLHARVTEETAASSTPRRSRR